MDATSLFFYLNCGVVVVAAAVGLLVTRSPGASLAYFLVSMFSLVGVFLFVGATVVAIAQLLFCVGTGLVYFFAIDSVDDASGEPSWSWLAILLGVAGACLMATLLFEVTPGGTDVLAGGPTGRSSFGAIGLEVIVHDGLALLAVGLVLLSSAVGAGFLASRGDAE